MGAWRARFGPRATSEYQQNSPTLTHSGVDPESTWGIMDPYCQNKAGSNKIGQICPSLEEPGRIPHPLSLQTILLTFQN